MKTSFLSCLISLVALLFPANMSAQEAYAVLEDSTLTFYYDNLKSSRTGTAILRRWCRAMLSGRCSVPQSHSGVAERTNRRMPYNGWPALDDSAGAQRASRFLQTDDCIDMTPIDAQTDRLTALLDYCEQELTPQKLRVFQLRHQQQKTYAEIASTLGISEAAVYKHLTMAGTSTMKISYRNQTTR